MAVDTWRIGQRVRFQSSSISDVGVIIEIDEVTSDEIQYLVRSDWKNHEAKLYWVRHCAVVGEEEQQLYLFGR